MAVAEEPILMQDPQIVAVAAKYPGKSAAQILIRYQVALQQLHTSCTLGSNPKKREENNNNFVRVSSW